MNETIIANRIKVARENLGITMAEASRRLNLSKIGYCRYEYGERTPSSQTLSVIAQCFETSVDYLTGKTDDMAPDYVILTKKDNPILFEFTAKCKMMDDAMLKRMMKYYEQLTSD